MCSREMELLGSSPSSLLTSRVTIHFLLLFCVLASSFSSSTTLSVAAVKLLPGFHTLPEIAAVDDFLELGSPRDSPLRQNKKYGKKEVELGRDGRPVCEVTKFGAAGTGEKYETSAIQAAIDACADFSGGGVVYFAPGTFLTGTVFLRSNITLWIDEGATILGSPLQSHFPLSSSQWYTILAQDVENVGVTGGGVVSGQGLKFVVQFQERKNVMVSWNSTDACLGDECRPRLIGFVNCKNVHIWNLVLQDPAYWW